MRFSSHTKEIIVKMFFQGMSIPQIAECYTTNCEVIEKLIREQLRRGPDK
jgi:hypothetical protein